MFKNKLRLIDIKAIVLFSIAWPIARILKLKYKDMWLLSERHGEARDNGYWMYKYIKENVPEQRACYVIDKNAKDRERIEQYGSIVDFGSFRHYILYLLASKHISAHIDADSPNSRISNFLEIHGLLNNKRVFLQHGITKDKISFGYYSVSRADLFVCAAKPEYDFCKKEFGYPDGTVQLLGFARFDGLGVVEPKRQILLMPTWRAWLAKVDVRQFIASEYYKAYQSLLNNEELHSLLEDKDIQLVFYPHSDMQKFVSAFVVSCPKITIAGADEYDIQELLNDSAMLVTDYSSVAFDIAFLNRPIVYYHFDYNKYREGQHPAGYFSYERDGFGKIGFDEKSIIENIKEIVDNNFVNDEKSLSRCNAFFLLRDRCNCSRIYVAIQKI